MARGRTVGLTLFAAIFTVDGSPVGPEWIRPRLAAERAVGGVQRVEHLGAARQAAFVCAADEETGIEGEACELHALGRRFRVVGRVRLDGRAELEARLIDHGDESLRSESDAMLCLRAYAAWGERFTDVIAGDFSFALWDGDQNRVLAVRDQLGKRPLFHASVGNTWLLSDSLDWIAERMPTAGAFDEYWVADFLTVGFSQEFERTIYRDIRRLAPAHLLVSNAAGVSIRRYWRLDVAEPLHLLHDADYGERYRDLLARAIADRLPRGRLGVAMSGGLDSTSIAACAVEACGDRARVVAACEHHRDFPESREDYYAGLVARHLGIELHLRNADDLAYDPHWRSRTIWHVEPTVYFMNAQGYRAHFAELARWASVWFHGEGPDNALAFDRNAYLAWLLRRGAWGRLTGALVRYARIKGRAGWQASVRRHVSSRSGEEETLESLPAWLNRDFAERCHLIERLRDLGKGSEPPHPWHPIAMASFANPIWASHFQDFDFFESLAPMVWRHPYLDLRLLQFMLSVPPVPWAWKKHLVREAMRGRLPPEILSREKTPLPAAPHIAPIRRYGLPEIGEAEGLGAYVDIATLPTDQASDSAINAAMSAHALAHWFALRQQKHCSHNVD